MVDGLGPELPAATTTVIPLSQRASTPLTMASFLDILLASVPRDMDST